VTTLPDFADDDTGKIRTEASRKDASDPGGELRGLAVAFIAHEGQDSRRWRFSMWAFGVAFSAALGVAGYAVHAAAETGADRARLEDVQARCARIEAQIDRLMERSER
jgi:hypothetical protein